MEPRNYEAGAAESPPAAPEVPSNGYPIAGNPATGTAATKPGPFWMYKVGESLRNVITFAGLTPSDADLTLLRQAIKLIGKPIKSFLFAANGYVIFDGGDNADFILQWGRKDFSSNNELVTYPIPFPNGVFAAIPYDVGAAIGGVATWDSTNSSLSQARFIFESNPQGMGYIAIGR